MAGAVHGKRVEDLEGDEARGLWGHSRSHEALRRLEASTSSTRRAARSVASLGLGGLFTMRITSCAVSSQSSCATAAHLLLLLLHSIALHLRLLLRAALLARHRHRCCCCLGASSGELLLSGLAGVALGLAHGQSHSSNRARALALPFFCSGAGAYLMRLAGDGRVRRGLVLRERVPDALGKHALAALVGVGRGGRVGGV